MKFEEILKRITGISTPVFGISWKPPKAEATVARKVIRFLEDRRVLYSNMDLEVPDHCVESILEIRSVLSKAIADLGKDSKLCHNLKALQAACRNFLDAEQAARQNLPKDLDSVGLMFLVRGRLHVPLIKFRTLFGVQIAQIAARYGLDIEDNLASILPPPDQVEET